MGGFAWVTLATNDSYSLGALVLAHSLKRVNTSHQLAVLITPAVSQPMKEQLETVFDVVKVVDVLDSKDETNLALLKRPELGITFTKIHCWRLTDFEKCVFLDADTLVVRNCDELFEREELSAAPDVGWPDCFNSGVFVYKPSVETFNNIVQLAVQEGSFDGGDQGLLNQYFSDWATQDSRKHLPFVYNLTSVAVYSYIPAFKHYGSQMRIVHFIGAAKPWLQQFDPASRAITPAPGTEHLSPLLEKWWDIFCEKVHPSLSKDLECASGMLNLQVADRDVAISLETSDEPGLISELIEPVTPYKEKDDSRQINLPYHPFEVKTTSGESLTQLFLQAREQETVEKQAKEEEERRLAEQRRLEEEERKEVATEDKENVNKDDDNDDGAPQEKIPDEEESHPEPDNNRSEEPPPQEYRSPFEYHTFFPDETCINTYLEQNVNVYQPFDSQNRNSEPEHHPVPQPEQQPKFEPHVLPRFLTIAENDPRQSNAVTDYGGWHESHEPQGGWHSDAPPNYGNDQGHHSESSVRDEFQKFIDQYTHPSVLAQRLQSSHENLHHTPEETVGDNAELQKSKSMSNLSEPPAAMTGNFWKSQPNVNADTNKKFVMPKLKPLLPKQSSPEPVKVDQSRPKITLYTEFHMSSDYKDPVKLPGDNLGFVERQILKEKRKPDSSKKFGALPYTPEPDIPEPSPPKQKSSPLREMIDCHQNVDYDLSSCKRQAGNKPSPQSKAKRFKENTFYLPELKPLVPEDDKRELFKKRKSDERLQLPEDGRRKKRDSRKARERKRQEANKKPSEPYEPTTDVNEILKKLVNYTKNYEDYFKIAEETTAKRKTPSPTIMINGKEIDSPYSPVEFYDKEYYFKDPASEFKIAESLEDGVILQPELRAEGIDSLKELTRRRLMDLQKYRKERSDEGKREEVTDAAVRATDQIVNDVRSGRRSIGKRIDAEAKAQEQNNQLGPKKLFQVEETCSKAKVKSVQRSGVAEADESLLRSAEHMQTEESRHKTSKELVQVEEEYSKAVVDSVESKSEIVEAVSDEQSQSALRSVEPNYTDESRQSGSKEQVQTEEISQLASKEQVQVEENSQLASNEPVQTEEERSKVEVKNVETKSGIVEADESLSKQESQSVSGSVELVQVEESNQQSDEQSSQIQTELPQSAQIEQRCSKLEEETLIKTECVDNNPAEADAEEELNEQTSHSQSDLLMAAPKSTEPVNGEAEELTKEQTSSEFNEIKEGETIISEDVGMKAESSRDLKTAFSAEVQSESTENVIPVDETDLEPRKSDDTMAAVQSESETNELAPAPETIEQISPPKKETLRNEEITEKATKEISKEEPFRQFRSFLKDRIETSQKGLLDIPEPLSSNKTFTSGMVISHALIPPAPEPENIPRDELTVENTAHLDSDSGVSTDETEPKSQQSPEDWTNLRDVTKSVAELVLNEPEEPMSEASKPLSYASIAQRTAPVPSASTSQPRKPLFQSPSPSKQSPKKSSQPRKFKQPSQMKPSAPSSPPTSSVPKSKPKKVEKPAEEVKTPSNIFEVLSDDSPDEFLEKSLPSSPSKKFGKSKKIPKSTATKTTLANLSDAPRVNIAAEDVNRESERRLADPYDNSGIAGAIAHLSLESEKAPTEASTSAQEEYLRRQNWETGQIDYLGRDSFDNIWSKICETIEKKDPQ